MQSSGWWSGMLVVGLLPAVAWGEAPQPQAGVSVSDPALAMLSFLGAAPAFADEKMAYRFGIGMPRLGGVQTTAFRELDGAPASTAFTSWSVSPELVMNGRFASAHVAFDLHFGREDALGGGQVAAHSFGLRGLYHSGLNLLGVIDHGGRAALSVGPLLNYGIGPFWTIQGTDGEATYGHLGVVQLAPSVSTNLLLDRFSFGAMGGIVPKSGIPWNFVEATMADSSGSYGTFSDIDPQSTDEAASALEKVRTQRAVLATGSAALHLYNDTQPFLTLGARVVYRHHEYARSAGGFGPATFEEDELRFLLSLGIGVPQGYAWQ